MAKTLLERITDLDAARTTKVDRMAALLKTSSDADETMGPDDAAEHDRLAADVKALDAEIARNKNLEALQVKAATPIIPSTSTKDADLRGGSTVITVKSNLQPGTGFVRYHMALLANKGSRADAVQWAEDRGWKDSSPEVILALKAAVPPATTTDATWAKPLVPIQNLTNEFIALLRPATLLGRIPNLRKVPFNVSVPMQTGGGSYNWVGKPRRSGSRSWPSDPPSWGPRRSPGSSC